MVCRSSLGGQHIKAHLKSSKPAGGAGEGRINTPLQLASHSGQPHPSVGTEPCQGELLCPPPLHRDGNSVEFLLP